MGWIHDPESGGGRIIGESCHFVDALQAVSGAMPVEVVAVSANPKRSDLSGDDTVSFTISFDDGSVGIVHYWANGDPSYSKEHLEVFGGERLAVMESFRRLDLVAGGRTARTRSLGADKGYMAEAKAFAVCCRTGTPSIPLDSILATSRVTFAVSDMLRGRADVVEASSAQDQQNARSS